MIDRITPVILTYNEAPNIARTLEKLTWARDVVIVDSLSSDETKQRAQAFPAVRSMFRREPTLSVSRPSQSSPGCRKGLGANGSFVGRLNDGGESVTGVSQSSVKTVYCAPATHASCRCQA